MNKIVLVTSISPKGIENQQLALDSWINSGFTIISCNIREEIELVEKYFPQIEFVEMQRDGRKIMGKPCPYIYDMLQVAKDRAENICGIVNSDIHLQKFSDEMYSYIKNQARNKVLFMRRNDVDTLEDIDKFQFRMFFAGIDAFFFNKTAVDFLEDDGLLIGQAMWDYWLPIMFYEKGVKINEIMNPVSFHIKHSLRWSDDITNDISWKICEKHFPNVERENAVYFLKDKFFQILSKLDMGICNLPDELLEKKVLVICNQDLEENIRNQIIFQTHKNIKVTSYMDDSEEYDYIIELPYILSLCYSFVDTALWIMDKFDLPFMKIIAYVRGNKTNSLHIDNCCNRALDRLNCELQTISIRKKECAITNNESLKVCSTYMCSIWIEEDEQTIWKRDGFEGRTLVYPAGYMARLWIRRYQNINSKLHVLGFADSSERMQNKVIEGLSVYSSDIVLQQDSYDKIVIVSNLYMEEIYGMLREIVPKEKLVVWNEFSLKNIDTITGR